MKIFIATKNQKKLVELERILIPMGFEVFSQKDFAQSYISRLEKRIIARLKKEILRMM